MRTFFVSCDNLILINAKKSSLQMSANLSLVLMKTAECPSHVVCIYRKTVFCSPLTSVERALQTKQPFYTALKLRFSCSLKLTFTSTFSNNTSPHANRCPETGSRIQFHWLVSLFVHIKVIKITKLKCLRKSSCSHWKNTKTRRKY